eukprot:TRINITY_DN51349_c0_g1_i1.p1 TRINITY_DN51349_c0_g1~~TRINITY_DN51349_c0_g1_i1.p1  ORF type:complete len:492 (+),score=30.11 TRINITY_DN51349_c0_g1_i1:56-1531(+)
MSTEYDTEPIASLTQGARETKEADCTIGPDALRIDKSSRTIESSYDAEPVFSEAQQSRDTDCAVISATQLVAPTQFEEVMSPENDAEPIASPTQEAQETKDSDFTIGSDGLRINKSSCTAEPSYDAEPAFSEAQHSYKDLDCAMTSATLLIDTTQFEKKIRSYTLKHRADSSFPELASALSSRLHALADYMLETDSSNVRSRRTTTSSGASSLKGELITVQTNNHFNYHPDDIGILYEAPPDFRVSDERLLNTSLGKHLMQRGLLGNTCAALALCYCLSFALSIAVFQKNIYARDLQQYVPVPNAALWCVSTVFCVLLFALAMHTVRREALRYCVTFKSVCWVYSCFLAALGSFLPLCEARLAELTELRVFMMGFPLLLQWVCASSLFISLDATVMSTRNKLMLMSCITILLAMALLQRFVLNAEQMNVQYCLSTTCISTAALQRTGFFQTMLATLGGLWTMRSTGCAFMHGPYCLKQYCTSSSCLESDKE